MCPVPHQILHGTGQGREEEEENGEKEEVDINTTPTIVLCKDSVMLTFLSTIPGTFLV